MITQELKNKARQHLQENWQTYASKMKDSVMGDRIENLTVARFLQNQIAYRLFVEENPYLAAAMEERFEIDGQEFSLFLQAGYHARRAGESKEERYGSLSYLREDKLHVQFLEENWDIGDDSVWNKIAQYIYGDIVPFYSQKPISQDESLA
jgi:hypothetical protein